MSRVFQVKPKQVFEKVELKAICFTQRTSKRKSLCCNQNLRIINVSNNILFNIKDKSGIFSGFVFYKR